MNRRILALPASRRTMAAVVAATAVTALTSGCQVFSPVQTNVPYVPADGVPATIGSLQISDLLLVSNGSGPAAVSGAVLNQGTEPATVQITPQQPGAAAGPAAQFEVAPGQQVVLADKGLRVTGVTAKPGTFVPITVQSSTGGTTVVNVPVLPVERYYATLLPGASTTEPTPTSS